MRCTSDRGRLSYLPAPSCPKVGSDWVRSEADQLRAQDRPDDHQKVGDGNPTHDAGQEALLVCGGVIRTRGGSQSHGAMTELAISATAVGLSLPFGTPRSCRRRLRTRRVCHSWRWAQMRASTAMPIHTPNSTP